MGTEAAPPSQFPNWVTKRDGRTEPFASDKINRALFNVIEIVTAPDPFLARELTDGVLHFLAQEAEPGAISTGFIRELVVKVVRELGQPELALAFERMRDYKAQAGIAGEGPVGPTDVQRFASLLVSRPDPLELEHLVALERMQQDARAVYSRNLIQACEAGVLRCVGFHAPHEFHSLHPRSQDFAELLERRDAAGVWTMLERLRAFCGDTLAFWLNQPPLRQLCGSVREVNQTLPILSQCAHALGLHVVINVGESAPRPEARAPLFDDLAAIDTGEEPTPVDYVLERLALLDVKQAFHWHWHVTEADLAMPARWQRLRKLIRTLGPTNRLTLVFDRPRRPRSHAEGLDERHVALLGWIWLPTHALWRHLSGNLSWNRFLGKLRILARLAVSMGVQKRDFLRQHGRPGRPPFLLENSHVAVYHDGLEGVLAEAGLPADDSGPWLEAVAAMRQALEDEGRINHLPVLLDDGLGARWSRGIDLEGKGWPADLKQAGKLRAAWGRSTCVANLGDELWDQSPLLQDLVRHALSQTQLDRLCLRPRGTFERQLTVA